MILDTEKDGLDAIFKPYVAKLIQYMWHKPAYMGNGISNAELHMWYNNYARMHDLPSRSIASIVQSTKNLAEIGILDFYEVTGKGGYARMYYPMLAPMMFDIEIRKRFNDKLDEIFKGQWFKPESHQSDPTAKKEGDN